MQIVVPDCLDDPIIEACFRKHLGAHSDKHIHFRRPSDEDELGARLALADCALIHFEGMRIGERALNRSPRLRVISIAGAGMGCVDLEAARSRGISVTTTPHAAVPAVAEMTVGLALSLTRNLGELDAQVRAGAWPVLHGTNLDGKIMGLLGLGAIGRHVARLATAFGMRVIAWSPNLTEALAAKSGAERRTLPELMSEADVISVHLRGASELDGVIDRAALCRMKSTAIFINTARASLVDEDALHDLLRDARIGGAGLDVFSSEPLPGGHRWRDLRNVALAPHTAWRTRDTLDRFVERGLANAMASIASFYR